MPWLSPWLRTSIPKLKYTFSWHYSTKISVRGKSWYEVISRFPLDLQSRTLLAEFPQIIRLKMKVPPGIYVDTHFCVSHLASGNVTEAVQRNDIASSRPHDAKCNRSTYLLTKRTRRSDRPVYRGYKFKYGSLFVQLRALPSTSVKFGLFCRKFFEYAECLVRIALNFSNVFWWIWRRLFFSKIWLDSMFRCNFRIINILVILSVAPRIYQTSFDIKWNTILFNPKSVIYNVK